MNIMAIEQYILSNMTRSEECRSKVISLKEEYFSNGFNKDWFNTLYQMFIEDKQVDVISVADELKQDYVKFIELLNKYDSLYFGKHMNTLKINYHKRLKIQQCQMVIKELTETPLDNVTDINTILHNIELVNECVDGDSNYVADIHCENVLEYENYLTNPSSLKYGIKTLDHLTDGIHKSEMTILAARPGQGKTAVAINIALNVAMQGKHVLILSLEMSKNAIVDRMISNIKRINSNVIRSRDFDEQQQIEYITAGEDFKKLNIRIEDSIFNIEEMMALINQIHKKKPLDYVVIDYIGLIETKQRVNSQNDRVSHISRQLKKIMQKTGIPMLILSQLNRLVEQRSKDDRRPILSDLRDSGSLEQDCNNCIMLYHDIEDPTVNKIPLEILLRKQRNGMLGTARVEYRKSTHRLYNH